MNPSFNPLIDSRQACVVGSKISGVYIYDFFGKGGPYTIFVVYIRPCLFPPKIQKLFKIPRHIESLDVCIEY